jgi:hypothetical protein
VKEQHDGWFHHLERTGNTRASAPYNSSLPEYSILIIQKDIIPNIDDPLTVDPNHKSEETKDERKACDDGLIKRSSHACQANVIC